MCKNEEEMKLKVNWLGSGVESRKQLLNNIQMICKPE